MGKKCHCCVVNVDNVHVNEELLVMQRVSINELVQRTHRWCIG